MYHISSSRIYIYNYFCITFAKQMKFCAQWSLLICVFFTLTRSQMVPPIWNQDFPLTGLGHMIWDAGWSDCEFWLWRTGECSNSPFSFNQNVMDDDEMKNEEADQANEDEMKLIRRKTKKNRSKSMNFSNEHLFVRFQGCRLCVSC